MDLTCGARLRSAHGDKCDSRKRMAVADTMGPHLKAPRALLPLLSLERDAKGRQLLALHTARGLLPFIE